MDYSTEFDFMAGDASKLSNKFLDNQEKIERDKYVEWVYENKDTILNINEQIKAIAHTGIKNFNVDLKKVDLNYDNAEKFAEYYKNLFYIVNWRARRSGAFSRGIITCPELEMFNLKWS